jgi:hypothetical protein
MRYDSSEQHELIKNPKYDVIGDDQTGIKCVNKSTGVEFKTLDKIVSVNGRPMKTGAVKLQKEGCSDFNDIYKSSCDDFFSLINARDQSYRTISNETDNFIVDDQSKKVTKALSNAASLTKCIEQRKKYTDECVCVGDKGHYEYIAVLENLREHYDLTVNSCSKHKFNLDDLHRYENFDKPYTELKADLMCKVYSLDRSGNPIKKKNIESNFIINNPNEIATKILGLMLMEFKHVQKTNVIYLSDLSRDSITIKSVNRYLLTEITIFPIDSIAIILKEMHTSFMELINQTIDYIRNEYLELNQSQTNPTIDKLCKIKQLDEHCKDACTLIYKCFRISSLKETSQDHKPTMRWENHKEWKGIYDIVKMISYSMYAKVKAGVVDFLFN